MRLPELPGYKLEELLEEDSFGWTFLSSNQDGGTCLVRILKAQATNDLLIYQSFKKFVEPDFHLAGVVEIDAFAFQNRQTLTAYATPFYGWKGKSSGKWQTTSLSRLRPFLEGEQVIRLVEKFAQRLGEIHEEGIFHGGLRPANVFISDEPGSGQDIKIGQFGEAFIAGTQYLEAGELLFYVSPEQLATGDFSGKQVSAWDVYSFGVIAFQMLTGHLPRLDTLFRQYQEDVGPLNRLPAIAHGQLTVASGHFSAQLEKERSLQWPKDPMSLMESLIRPVIERCLSFEPAKRYSNMTEVASALRAAAADWEELREQENAAREEISVPVEKERFRLLPRKTKLSGTASGPAGVISQIKSPSLGWRIAGAASLITVIPLAISAMVFYYNWKQSTLDLELNYQENQEDIEKQASTYRQILKQSRKSADQLQSELSEAEDSKSRLIGEAKLARQIIRQSQENGDQIFRLILDNRDTDVPGFREDRKKVLDEAEKHYERLVEVYGNAPDFIVSTANAMYFLGEIHKEKGEFGKALAAFGEAEKRYLAVREDGGKVNADSTRNLARAKRSLGELSMKNGRYSSAIHFFGESSTYWDELRDAYAEEKLNATVNVQENLLEIAECERIMNHLGTAIDAGYSIGSQLMKLREQSPDDHRVLSALAKSFALVGRILEGRGDVEKAIEAYQQSSDLFAKAVKLNAAVDAYQLGLGNSLARVGLLKNDIKKLQAAVDVLAEVIPGNPYEFTYQKTLSDVYGVLAKNQRDGGQHSNAIVLEGRAVSILRPLIQNNPAAPADVRFSYGERLADLSELLGDAGKYDDSRGPLREAIDVFAAVASSENAKPIYRRALARAQGLFGFACLNSGDKASAKTHYQLAQSEWKTYMKLNPNDADAARAAKWTQDQLSGL